VKPWIGVDLDGTLAEHYWPSKGPYETLRIGDPVPAMVARIKRWIAAGRAVKVFTARVDATEGEPLSEQHRDVTGITAAIQAWCVEHIGVALPVTSRKDFGMVQLWDDRAVRVIENTGERCCARVFAYAARPGVARFSCEGCGESAEFAMDEHTALLGAEFAKHHGPKCCAR
jgi:hypothetical protein